MDERNSKLDILRGIAVFIVVLGHMIPATFTLHAVIYLINNQLFFLLSGYLFYGTWKKQNSGMTIIIKKAKTILIPYISWSIVAALVRWAFRTDHSASALVKWTWDSIVYANGVWFLIALFDMYILCILGLLVFEKRKLFYLIPFFLIVMCPYDIFAIYNTKKMLVFFVIGFLFAYKNKQVEELENMKIVYSFILLILGTICVSRFNRIGGMQVFINIIYGIGGSVLIYAILVPFFCRASSFIRKRIELYGKESLLMYPVTQMFSEIILKMCIMQSPLYEKLLNGNYLCEIVLIILSGGFAIIAMEFTVAIDNVLKKIDLWNILFCGRKKSERKNENSNYISAT